MPQPDGTLCGIRQLSIIKRGFHWRMTGNAADGVKKRPPACDTGRVHWLALKN